MEIKHPQVKNARVNKEEKSNLSNFVKGIECIDTVDNRETGRSKLHHNFVYEDHQNQIIYHRNQPEKFFLLWVYQQLRDY
jgi:hypothetical protein